MKPGGYHLLLKRGAPLFPPPPDGPGPGWQIARPWVSGQGGARLDVIDLGETGLLLGTLYDRGGTPVTRPHAATIRRWIDSGGRALLRDYWGSYVAILRTEARTLVLRDPSGTFPCYWMEEEEGLALASDMAWAGMGGHRFRGIDWNKVLAQLQFHSRRSVRTALSGVQELLPGCALDVGDATVRTHTLWSPHDHVPRSPPDFAEATDTLREAVRISVAAQARRYMRPLIALSGGLDSSIVTACMAEANPDTQCLTFRGGAGDLDESPYARAVADHFSLPLHVEQLDRDAVDLRHSTAEHLPVPSARSFSEADDRQAMHLAEAIGADAFFLGHGGDNIFWYFNTATAAVDRLRSDGLCGFMETSGDLARMCDVTHPEVVQSAARKLFRHRLQPWTADMTFLAGPGREPASVPPHPWEATSHRVPLGLQAYVRALIQLQDHHGYFDREILAPVHSALIAQPILEACLGMPSWLSCREGRNRAVARAAFADSLPRLIVERQAKGGFGGFTQQLLGRHLPQARDLLLGGRLAAQGLLDRSALEPLLSGRVPLSGETSNRLLRLVAIEAWLQLQAARSRG